MKCKVCRETKPMHRNGECRRCCTIRCNGAALEKIIDQFKPASRYNREIFDIYVSHLKSRYIKNSALPAARKFAGILAQKKLPELEDWDVVGGLSSEFGIKYGGKIQGCPVTIVGRVLQSQGKILPRNEGRAYSIKNITLELNADNLLLFENLRADLLQGKSGSYVVRHAKCILDLQKAMRGKSILLASESDLARHFKSYHSSGVAKIEDDRKIFKRIFSWALSTNLIRESPAKDELAKLQSCFCPECEKVRIFTLSDKLCNNCYLRGRYEIKVAALERESHFADKYNGYLFNLYLIYIRRFQIKPYHIRTTRLLCSYLQKEKVEPILTWLDVKNLAHAFANASGHKKFKGGYPIEKIGYMLQELGVIGYRHEDHEVHLESLLSKQEKYFAKLLRAYAESMIRARRTQASAYYTLFSLVSFDSWMSTEFGATGLLTVNKKMMCRYFEENKSGEKFAIFHKFYRWLKFKKLILINPFDGLNTFSVAKSLEILSDELLKKLHRFIRNQTSDPEQALILALVLFWGFSTTDLTYAQVNHTNDLKINLYLKPLSYRRKRAARAKQFILPKEPRWLNELEKRFLVKWQEKHNRLPNSFNLRPLIMAKNLRSPRPLRPLAIQKRFYEATRVACGIKVPINVIRRTGAHLFTRKLGEASILTEFGWSKDYSFDFLWMPRKLYTEAK